MIIDKHDFNDTKIGNKAKNLIWFESLDIPTSSFEVIVMNNLISNYQEIIEKIRKNFTKNNFQKVSALLQEIKFNDTAIKEDFSRLQKYHNQKVSFRTSAGMEDLLNYSFAGIYKSFLNITLTEETFKKYLLLCLKSLFTSQVFSYIQKNKIDIEEIDFSIIVQKMFNAQVSGITFTSFPFSKSTMVLGSGLAENLVNGSSAEECLINKNLAKKNYPNKITQNNLETEFQQLLRYIEAITYLKMSPQDIEWSICANHIAILQTRDVTAQLQEVSSQKITFDCTNISESYPDTTTPLTYSFIQYAYSKVYANFMELIGVKKSAIQKKSQTLESLLGYINGSVYYQINNWYEMIKILPGYKYNKDFFEAMLVPQKKRKEKQKTKTQRKNKSTLIQKISTLPVILKFSYKLLFYKKDSQKFIKTFDKNFKKFQKTNFAKLNISEIAESYKNLEKHFLGKWKIPILNDFRLMIFHGLLSKTITKITSNKNQKFINSLISNFKSDDELKVVKALDVLVEEIKKSPTLKKLFTKTNNKLIYTALLVRTDEDVINFKKNFDNYIVKYGSRRPDELKLESVRIEEKPEFIINIIKNLSDLKSKKTPNTNKENATKQILLQIKKESLKNKGQIIGWTYYFLIKFLSHYTKKSIQLREIFRLRRGMVYTIARDHFLEIDNIFNSSKIIKNKKDIFYLKKEEIFDMISCNLLEKNFLDIISIRKKKLATYQDKKLPKRLILDGIGEKSNIQNDESPSEKTKGLTGLATSDGIITGRTVVVEKFNINADYKDKILVTYQTDPGWTIIFPLLKGIILEKGNTLSHAAILSRELGIPCVVKVPNAVDKIQNNSNITLDGNSGTIKIDNLV